jgi:flagellar FliL protein
MANEQAAAKAEEKSKRKLPLTNILIIVLLLVIIGGGAYFLFLRPSDSAPAAAAPVAEVAPVAEAVPVGVVVRLEPIFINLAGERFLKLGLALQTSQEEEAEGAIDGALALDAAIEVFSDQQLQDLSSMERRGELKQELLDRITEGYGPTVTNIYFTEFVMQ